MEEIRRSSIYRLEKNVTQSAGNESINIPLILPIRQAQKSKNNKGISPYVLIRNSPHEIHISSPFFLWNEQSHSVEKRKREETRGFRALLILFARLSKGTSKNFLATAIYAIIKLRFGGKERFISLKGLTQFEEQVDRLMSR